jgi:uncharacterized membrane protein (DUF2068 family)
MAIDGDYTMTKFKTAAVLMIIQGGLMELGVCLGLLPMLVLGINQVDASEHFSFIVPYLQENLFLMMAMSGVFGAVRLVGAIGVLRNRMWGLVLSTINCSVTMALMIFMLPAGLLDGLLSCTALVLMLMGYFGGREIIPHEDAGQRPALSTHIS